MKNEDRKKELRALYSEREITGGVYLIRNTLNNKLFLDTSLDMQSSKNRFEFALKTGSSVYLKLKEDMEKHGADRFVFEVLEEHKKGKAQTNEEFKSDISALTELWREKLAGESFY
ncbi:MAG: GIY-YIG nuclease family protein [Oscillospiraceae bacterium]|nr:GIY-YIG nuclease family protein [Oscillospiraceae bacterium]